MHTLESEHVKTLSYLPAWCVASVGSFNSFRFHSNSISNCRKLSSQIPITNTHAFKHLSFSQIHTHTHSHWRKDICRIYIYVVGSNVHWSNSWKYTIRNGHHDCTNLNVRTVNRMVNSRSALSNGICHATCVSVACDHIEHRVVTCSVRSIGDMCEYSSSFGPHTPWSSVTCPCSFADRTSAVNVVC